MKKLTFATLIILAMSAPAVAADATGLWRTQSASNGGYLQVRIEACGANLCGTIAGAFTSDGKAVAGYKNDGKQMIWDMKPDGAGKWDDGKVWSPEANITANGKLSLDGSKLTVSGCKGPICRSQEWTRVE
ncbi:DUF2147 domain-containing protein [Hoeflea poritis]|uniref:DUF2147 domain-containing protein n=1 Tax=Hoeflea poritis TaxID=2993659 RepID=A0ABT4VGF1_9HYPH|nr:DUF2147 domain-containing protein [Hoeflea poritis]MDA4843781.1 DUF2147 domain-containing protein [Hoeflea poritis]